MRLFTLRTLKLIFAGMLATTALLAGASEQPTTEKKETEPVKVEQAQTKVNINTATLDQLVTLPRIGPAIGQRIIDFRTEHGAFQKLEDLMNVRGIGPKTFETLKPLISL